MVEWPPIPKKHDASFRVICVKVGEKYSGEYVIKLRNMCARHLPPHDFVCVTDDPGSLPFEGVTCTHPTCDLEGWWQKIGLFQRGLFPGLNMYLDLDVVITSSLWPVVARARSDRDVLWTLDDFGYPLRGPGDVQPPHGTINSSLMLWHGIAKSQVYSIWERFSEGSKFKILGGLHGDQNWITQCLYPAGIKFVPDGYAKSFKYNGEQLAPLVIFHGDPKPAAVKNKWVVQHWN